MPRWTADLQVSSGFPDLPLSNKWVDWECRETKGLLYLGAVFVSFCVHVSCLIIERVQVLTFWFTGSQSEEWLAWRLVCLGTSLVFLESIILIIAHRKRLKVQFLQ